MFNTDIDGVSFALAPPLTGSQWHLAVDTTGEAPRDIYATGEEPLVEDMKTIMEKPQSNAILLPRNPQHANEGRAK